MQNKEIFYLQLKHLAFGLPNRQRVQSGSEHGHTNGSHSGEAPKQQWDEWQKMDQEVCSGGEKKIYILDCLFM